MKEIKGTTYVQLNFNFVPSLILKEHLYFYGCGTVGFRSCSTFQGCLHGSFTSIYLFTFLGVMRCGELCEIDAYLSRNFGYFNYKVGIRSIKYIEKKIPKKC